jgi:hypothetical protein
VRTVGFIQIDGSFALNYNQGFEFHKVTEGLHEYEASIAGLLQQLSSNPAGQVLLNFLKKASNGSSLVIYRYAQQGAGDINAFSSGKDALKQRPKGAPLLGSDGKTFGNTVGTGGGSNVRVAFTPNVVSHPAVGGFRADEVLFHELTHSFRQLRGHLMTKAMTGDFNNREEFLATLTANIYVSAEGEHRALRGSYTKVQVNAAGQLTGVNVQDSAQRFDTGALRAGLTESESFVQQYLGIVTQLFEEEREFATALGRVNCIYNPFRDYEKMYGAAGGGKPQYDANWK